MTADEFLLFRVCRFLGITQLPLQELDLLFELALILLPLFLRCGSEMRQCLAGVLVLFLQRHTVRFFLYQLPFHVLDALSHLCPNDSLFLEHA